MSPYFPWSFFFTANIPIEAFLVAFHILHQTQLPAELQLSHTFIIQRQCLHVNLGQPIPVPTFCSLAFCFPVHRGVDHSTILASCHICSTSLTLMRTTLPLFTPALQFPTWYISFRLLVFAFNISHPKLLLSILSSTFVVLYASRLKHTISNKFYLGSFPYTTYWMAFLNISKNNYHYNQVSLS